MKSQPTPSDIYDAELKIEQLTAGYLTLYKEFLWVDKNRANYSLDTITSLYYLKNMRFLYMASIIPQHILNEVDLMIAVDPIIKEEVLPQSKFIQLKIRFAKWIMRL